MSEHKSEVLFVENCRFLFLDDGHVNEFRKRLFNGDASWIIPTSKDEVKVMFRHCCYKPVSFPGPVSSVLKAF